MVKTKKQKTHVKIESRTLLLLILIIITFSVTSALLVKSGITGYGVATGFVNVTVSTITTISILTSTLSVNFGTMATGEQNDTTDNAPAPLNLSNDGNQYLNVTVSGTSLWSTVDSSGANWVDPGYYWYACGNGASVCNATGKTSMANVTNSTSATLVFAFMPYAAGTDWQELDINITVPSEEQAGAKTSTLTFTSSSAY